MSDRATLLEMGFDAERVDWALHAAPGGLQSALDHLEAHQDEPVPDWRAAGGAAEPSAASIKCNDCGKLFRDMDLAMYHAEKSGHESFEESSEAIKPLSAEEREARLAELRSKAARRRADKASEDAKQERANELIRRKAGQESAQIREDLERKERIKEAERKRKERLDDVCMYLTNKIAAKERVRAQIEQDKRDRAERFAREKALREGRPLPGASAAPSAAASAAAAPRPTSNASEARLRIRGPGGMWMGTLPAEATLADVELAVNSAQGGSAQLEFSTAFPRRKFTDAERGASLRELGLVPNAALDASAK